MQIFGVADDATYRDNWPLLQATSDVWDRVARGEAALVNEQLSRRDHLNIGDPLILPGGWTTVIVGSLFGLWQSDGTGYRRHRLP